MKHLLLLKDTPPPPFHFYREYRGIGRSWDPNFLKNIGESSLYNRYMMHVLCLEEVGLKEELEMYKRIVDLSSGLFEVVAILNVEDTNLANDLFLGYDVYIEDSDKESMLVYLLREGDGSSILNKLEDSTNLNSFYLFDRLEEAIKFVNNVISIQKQHPEFFESYQLGNMNIIKMFSVYR